MAAVIRVIIPVLLLGLLWSASQTAYLLPRDGLLTAPSLLALTSLLLAFFITLLFALLPALALYAPENNSRVNVKAGPVLAVWNPSKTQVLLYVALAYATTIFLFAVVFLLINNYDEKAFTPGLAGLGTASYFSVVTIATVGYGDILPVSGWARSAASAEILVGVGYTVLFFSIIAGFLRERRR